MALLNSAKLLKERIAVCGVLGADYEAELQCLEINPQIGLTIAKKLLQPSGYQFIDKVTGLNLDLAQHNSYNLTWTCIAPEATARWAYGFENADQYAYFQEKQMKKEGDTVDLLAPATILANLGKSGADGLTYQEISSGGNNTAANTKNVSTQVDKLFVQGLVTKNVIMPKEKMKKMTSTTVVHLRRYARQYNPIFHQVKLFPGENIRNELFRFFRRILDVYDVESLPCADLSYMFKLDKRVLQNLRAQAIYTSRNDSHGPIIQFLETVSAPIKHKEGRPDDFGSFRILWVVQRGPGAIHPHEQPVVRPQEIIHRCRNLSMFEQIDTAITASGERGLSTADLRSLTGLNAKKTSKLAEALRKNLHYPSIRELEGKNMVYRLISHAVAAGSSGGCAAATADSDDLAQAPQPQAAGTPKSILKKATRTIITQAKKQSAGKKRRRRDSDSDFESDEESNFSGDSDSKEDDEGLEAQETVLKQPKPVPQLYTAASSSSSAAAASKGQHQSQPLLQRVPMILEYLQSQSPHYCGCVMEVNKLIRESTGTFVDRKTILRAVNQLVATGQIRVHTWERSPDTIAIFGGMHGNQVIFMLLVTDDVQDMSDEQRIAEYCAAYKANHPVPSKEAKRKRQRRSTDTATASAEIEAEGNEGEGVQQVEMDVDNSDVMGHRLLQSTQSTAAPAASSSSSPARLLPPPKPVAKKRAPRKPKVKAEAEAIAASATEQKEAAAASGGARRVSFQVPSALLVTDAMDVDEPPPPPQVAAANRIGVVPLQAYPLHTQVKPTVMKQQQLAQPAAAKPPAKSKKGGSAAAVAAASTFTMSAEEMVEMDRQHKQDQLKAQQADKDAQKAKVDAKQKNQAAKQQPQQVQQQPPEHAKAAANGNSSSPDNWNEEQDRALLESFLLSFLVRSARQGLPMILKPSTNTPRWYITKGKQKAYDLVPWQSPTLDIDFGTVQLAELRQLYITTSGIAIDGQGLSSCRRRLPVLLKGIRDIRQLVVQLLWMGAEKMHVLARDVCMFVVRERYSRLSLPAAMMMGYDQEQVLQRQMIVNRLLQYCEPGVYPSFTIQDLLQPMLDSAQDEAEDDKDEQQEELKHELRSHAIAIIRELYLHHVLRREGTDDDLDNNNFENTRFYLAPSFASSILERPFGSFFYDILGAGDGSGSHTMMKDENIEEDPVSSDYKEAKALLTVAIATEHIASEHIATVQEYQEKVAIRADIIDENRMIQRPIDEITNHPIPPQNEVYTTNASREVIDKRKSFERVEAQLSIDTTAVRLASRKFFMLTQQQAAQDMTLPWVDSSTGEIKANTLRMYAVQVMSYLAEHPGSGTIKQLHALLFLLSLQAAQALMDMLVAADLVRVRQPEITVKLPSAFAGLEFWATRNMGSAEMAEAVYEIVV